MLEIMENTRKKRGRMRQISTIENQYSIRLALPGGITAVLNLTWLLALPLVLWAVASYFVPIFGSFFAPLETWLVTALIAVLCGASLVAHVLAHSYAANGSSCPKPLQVSLFLFGDAAQAWPASPALRKEVWAAFAGPLANLVIAGLAYLAWNAQWNPILNVSMLFLCGFNLWMAVINLMPGFPMDGGRLDRAILRGIADRPQAADRVGFLLGYLQAAAIAAWGLFLFAQQSRFSLETAVTSILFALLILAGLRMQPAWKEAKIVLGHDGRPVQPVRALVSGLLILCLAGIAASLLLTNNGIEAPGLALSVEPMVEVPPPYLHPHPGTFILTSVLDQAPILAVEWLAGQVNPAVEIVPPETIVPKNTTPQEVAQQGYQMMDQSETTAIVTGLRLAGYPAEMVGKGVLVASILPDSPAKSLLQPGDIITAIDGKPVQVTSDLIDQVKTKTSQATVRLDVQRDQQKMQIDVPLMPPAAPGGAPKLGISIEDAGFDVKLPFDVKILPQKIVGGPSAGLMFTLTVFNQLSPIDLTGGRKIAGTGTIEADGSVGPIGGVKQKVAAAEAAGAEYFLSPVENYADAASVARQIKVVKIATAEQAVQFLRSLPAK